jgi:hypothetical protein
VPPVIVSQLKDVLVEILPAMKTCGTAMAKTETDHGFH